MLSDAALWTRTLERLVISLFAGGALFLSWDLLRRALLGTRNAPGAPKAAEGRRAWPLFVVAAAFGLFGGLILWTLLTSSLHTPGAGNTVQVNASESTSIQVVAEPAARRLAMAINTVQGLDVNRLGTDLTETEVQALQAAIEELDSFRTAMVRQHFGERSWEIYQSYLEASRTTPGIVPDDFEKIVRTIDAWMQGSHLDSRAPIALPKEQE